MGVPLRNLLSAVAHIIDGRRHELDRRLARSTSDGARRLRKQLDDQIRSLGQLMAHGDGLGAEIDPAVAGYACALADGAEIRLQLIAHCNTHDMAALGQRIDGLPPYNYTAIVQVIAENYGARWDLRR